MKYPKLSASTGKILRLPPFKGGIGGRDTAAGDKDNRLADCENLYFSEGLLRSREGIHFSAEDISTETLTEEAKRITEMKAQGTGENRLLLTEKAVLTNGSGQQRAVTSYKALTLCDGLVETGYTKAFSEEEYPHTMAVPQSGLLRTGAGQKKQYGSLVFACSDTIRHIGAFSVSGSSYESVSDMAYVPTRLLDGRPTDGTEASDKGYLFEKRNLLTNRARYCFTSDGKGYCFNIPDRLTGTVRLEIGGLSGSLYVKEFTPVLNPYTNCYEYEWREPQFIYGMYTAPSGGQGATLWLENNVSREEPDTHPFSYSGVPNNIVVEGTMDREFSDVIWKMQFNTWFGGDRSTQNGGTRLFLAGHPDKKNLIHWSATDNPLYFPENNYACIGSAASAVTAMARHGDRLILFKENEMYYVRHVASAEYTAEDVMNGKRSTATEQSLFPITPLHPAIGCDCPQTVQLCESHLLWADSAGRVYALNSTQVTDISDGIAGRLTRIPAEVLKRALSFQREGYYHLYIPDGSGECYSLYGRSQDFLRYTRNGAAEEKAGVPWYLTRYQTNDIHEFLPFADGLFLCLSFGYETVFGHHLRTVYAKTEGISDCCMTGDSVLQNPIVCTLRTRLYDFGAPEEKKDIRQMYLSLYHEDKGGAAVTYHTETQDSYDAPLRPAEEKTSGPSVRRLTPRIRKTGRFGFSIQCKSPFALDSAAIKYTRTGRYTR